MWNTVYIKGNDGFKEAVLSKLDSSWLLGASETAHNLIMFWLADNLHLRDFKMAIGSQIIFKYRLHFITNLGEYIRSESKRYTGLSQHEKKMILEMETWEKDRAKVLRIQLIANSLNLSS